VRLADRVLSAPTVVAATGSFANPHVPALPGAGGFTGRVVHAAHYREPAPFAGLRVVVVGGGNSAVQIGYELASVASVTLAVRSPIRFGNPGRYGQRVAFRVLNRVPSWAFPMPFEPVLDDGRFRRALDLRPMFAGLDGDRVVWADGGRERVDALVLATGYRPDVAYLEPLGALDPAGRPRHVRGLSVTHPGLVYVGLNWQRTPASNSLRGVGADARYLARRLAAHLRRHPR
jgi:putative flavoprotein involved in K+ transport